MFQNLLELLRSPSVAISKDAHTDPRISQQDRENDSLRIVSEKSLKIKNKKHCQNILQINPNYPG